MAFPRDCVPAGPEAVAAVVRIALDEEVSTVVIGQPLSLSGVQGESAKVAQVFADGLRAALEPHGISVARFDERFTTTTAAQQLRSAGSSAKSARAKIDSAAATVLLEAFLEASRGDH
jgi:putative Holliday junction resolvase